MALRGSSPSPPSGHSSAPAKELSWGSRAGAGRSAPAGRGKLSLDSAPGIPTGVARAETRSQPSGGQTGDGAETQAAESNLLLLEVDIS